MRLAQEVALTFTIFPILLNQDSQFILGKHALLIFFPQLQLDGFESGFDLDSAELTCPSCALRCDNSVVDASAKDVAVYLGVAYGV